MDVNEIMTDEYVAPTLAENGNIYFGPSVGGQIITPTEETTTI